MNSRPFRRLCEDDSSEMARTFKRHLEEALALPIEIRDACIKALSGLRLSQTSTDRLRHELQRDLGASHEQIEHTLRVLDLQVEFTNLVNLWRDGRGPSSSLSKLVLHPSYQRIIGLGPRVLPLLLAEMKRAPDQWFWALRAISGEDPVLPEHAGDVAAMAADWMRWGERNGYIDADPCGEGVSKAG